ncbi:MAG: AMP-binding protein [Candidatus Caldatribacteriota bacterium]
MNTFNSLITILMNSLHEQKTLTFYENGKEVESLSLKQLLMRSYRRVEELRRLKLSSRSIVLLEGTNNSNFLVNFFAIQMTGCTPVPVSPGHFISDKRFAELILSMIRQTRAEVFLSNPIDKKTLSEYVPVDFLVVDQTEFSNTHLEKLEDVYLPRPQDMAFIQFSSGSTGDPKGVVITHENLMSNLEQIRLGLKQKEGDQVATWLPVHHDMGLIGCLLFPIYANLPVHVMRPFDFAVNPKRWLKMISDKKISITCAPNSAYHMCTTKIKEERKKDLDLSSLRVALCGAEPINAKTLQNFINSFKNYGLKETIFLPCYGMAENVLAISFTNPEEKLKIIHIDKDLMASESKVQLETPERGLPFVSCGKPLPGVDVKVLSKDETELGENEIGQIVIKSKSTTSGYYKRDDVNMNLFYEGYLKTGDLGFIHNGEIYIVGRSKDLIIINGLNLCPEEIEKQILEVPEVRPGRLAAFAVPNKDESSEEIQVVVELKGHNFSSQRREIIREKIAQVASELIAIKAHQVSIVPPGTVVKTTSGKIKRSAMRDMYLRGRIDTLEDNYEFYALKNLVKNKVYSVKFFIDEFLGDKVSVN